MKPFDRALLASILEQEQKSLRVPGVGNAARVDCAVFREGAFAMGSGSILVGRPFVKRLYKPHFLVSALMPVFGDQLYGSVMLSLPQGFVDELKGHLFLKAQSLTPSRITIS